MVMMWQALNFVVPMRFKRSELFAGLYIIGCANGLVSRMIQSVHRVGWADAAVGTFDVSVIVLVACFIGISLVSPEHEDETRIADLAVAFILLLMMVLPIGALSWFAVTMLALYHLVLCRPNETERRGAIILLAVTVPMLWSRLVFDLFANFILGIDAALVGWMLSSHRAGNMVEFADHSGTLAIFPSCSSLANVSLAVLCWVTVSEYVKHQRRFRDFLWCLLACCSVVAVNVLRISVMGLSAAHYLALHSPIAESILSALIVALILVISLLGVRHDASYRV
jgi:hypothetical protein